MKGYLLSRRAYKLYSGFFINLAAAWFFAVPASIDFNDLTHRISLFIIYLYFSISLDYKVYVS